MSTLTLETLKATLAGMPHGPAYFAVVTQPQHATKFRAQLNQGIGGLPTIQLYAKTDQVAEGWLFSDNRLLRDYLAGKISELDLLAYGSVKSMGGS